MRKHQEKTVISLAAVKLPDFGDAGPIPVIPTEQYEQRLQAAVERIVEFGLDCLLVYADREHTANMAWLTGFDPRFEEAALLLDTKGNRLLLVGNECLGYLPDPALKCEVELFQDFSLMGQPRDSSRPLKKILSGFGIAKGTRVGCTGWKYFGEPSVSDPTHTIEIPAYIVDELRGIAGGADAVLNAGQILMDPDNGLRIINSAQQIARHEYAGVKCSTSIIRAIANLHVGIEERQAAQFFCSGGLPLTCHPMTSFGQKARRGLASPSDNKARLGDVFTLAFGCEGSLCSRAGMIASGPDDLPEDVRDFYREYYSNYFEVVACWYETVKVGAVAGDVFEAVDSIRRKDIFEFALNPGHYIQIEEWVHSPFAKGSPTALRSGMAIQMDIIPVPAGPFCASNLEDGIALADEALRDELAISFPDEWGRIAARRQFMREVLGIALDDSVLPLSNCQGWLAPYALSPGQMLVKHQK